MLDHMKRCQARYLMNCMKDWKEKSGIHEKKMTMANMDQEMVDMQLVQDGNTVSYQKQKALLEEATRTT